jgi:hypothetical protein
MASVPIPNELKIIINTSIPGYQNIRYKPSMTLPSDKVDDAVQFNPLVKLKPSIIKSLPKEIQVKEFFNKGLFQSLMNSHGLVRAKSLLEATNEGYVDNNIQVTLDTIFPTNGVLYINKQPYAIADVQWTKGDWKIDKKIQHLPDLDSNRITDPYLYNAVVKDEIISGEKELEILPKDILYGPNYTGPTSVAKGVENVGPLAPPPPTPPAPTSTALVTTNKPYRPIPPTNQIKPYKPTPIPLLPPSSSTTIKPYKPSPLPLLPPPPPPPLPPKKPNKPLQITNGDTNNLPPNKPPKILKIEYGPLTPMNAPTLIYSRSSSMQLKTYFQQKNYYDMVNTMFQNMNEQEKNLVVKIFKQTTAVDAKYNTNNISKAAYDESVSPGLKVNSNIGGGDCFFIAVADAINYYNANCKTMEDRIIYNNYGNKIPYTQMSLREIVAYQLTHLNKSEYERLYGYLNVNVEFLNNEFQNEYKNFIENVSPQMPENVFFDIINNIYLGNDNFLVAKPTSMTQQTLQEPFTIIDRSNYVNYIKSSDYWADFFAIDSICEILNLNIINIEKQNNNLLSVPYISNNSNSWTRYMFLYHENKHYEVISFDYTFRKIVTEPKFSEKKIYVKKVIFNKEGTVFPPFYIIFLVFASYYINILDENARMSFQLFPNNMLALLDNIFRKILSSPNDKQNKRFLTLVKEYFNPSILRKFGVSTNPFAIKNDDDDDDYSGGAPQRYNPSQNPYQYQNPYQNQYQYQNPYQNQYQNPYQYQNQYQNPYQYQNQYRQPFVSSYVKNNPNTQEINKTNIGYYITIDMELQRGTTLSSKDLSNSKCRQRWNAVRKSYANMRGLPYTILPDYNNLPSSSSSSKKTTTPAPKNTTQKFRQQQFKNNNNNKTRRYY